MTFFAELTDLGGEEVELYRLAGYLDQSGHHSAVFEPAETVTFVIRPWQSDFGQVIPEGMTGQTPGVKVYADESHTLRRGDRFHYRDGAFRLMNPQYDQLNGLERWDGQTDEREFRLLDELRPEHLDALEDPDQGYGDL